MSRIADVAAANAWFAAVDELAGHGNSGDACPERGPRCLDVAAADDGPTPLAATLDEMDLLLADDIKSLRLTGTARRPPRQTSAARRWQRTHADTTESLGLLASSTGSATLPSLRSRPSSSGSVRRGKHTAHGVNLQAISTLSAAKLAAPVSKAPTVKSRSQLDAVLTRCGTAATDDAQRLQRVRRCAADTHLRHLAIDDAWNSSDVVELCSVIAAHPSLTSLEVSHSSLSSTAINALQGAVARNKNITMLRTADPHGRTVGLSATAAMNARARGRRAARQQARVACEVKATSHKIVVEQLALVAVSEMDVRRQTAAAERAAMEEIRRSEKKDRDAVYVHLAYVRTREAKLAARRQLRASEVAARGEVVAGMCSWQQAMQRRQEAIHRACVRTEETTERNHIRMLERHSWGVHKLAERARVAREQEKRDGLAQVETDKRTRIVKQEDRDGEAMWADEEEERKRAIEVQDARLEAEESERKRREQAALQAKLEAEWMMEKARRAQEQFATLQHHERLDVIDGENNGRNKYLLQREAHIQALRDWHTTALRVTHASERLTKVLVDFKRILASLEVDPVCRYRNLSAEPTTTVFFYNSDQPTRIMQDVSFHTVVKGDTPPTAQSTPVTPALGSFDDDEFKPKYTRAELERLNRLPTEVGAFYEVVKQHHATHCQAIDNAAKVLLQMTGEGQKGLKKMFPRFTVFTPLTKRFELPSLAQFFCILTYPREVEITVAMLPPDDEVMQSLRMQLSQAEAKRASMARRMTHEGGRGVSRMSFRKQISQGKVQTGPSITAARRSVHQNRRESMEIDAHLQQALAVGTADAAMLQPRRRSRLLSASGVAPPAFTQVDSSSSDDAESPPSTPRRSASRDPSTGDLSPDRDGEKPQGIPLNLRPLADRGMHAHGPRARAAAPKKPSLPFREMLTGPGGTSAADHTPAVTLSGIEQPPELPQELLRVLTKRGVSMVGALQRTESQRYPSNIAAVYPAGDYDRHTNTLTAAAGNVSPTVIAEYLRTVGYWCAPSSRRVTTVVQRKIEVTIELEYSCVNTALIEAPLLQCFTGTERKSVTVQLTCSVLPPYLALPRRVLRLGVGSPRSTTTSPAESPRTARSARSVSVHSLPDSPDSPAPNYTAFAGVAQPVQSFIMELCGADEAAKLMDLVLTHAANPLARGRDRLPSQHSCTYNHGEKVDGEDFCSAIVVEAPARGKGGLSAFMGVGAGGGMGLGGGLPPMGGGDPDRDRSFDIGITLEVDVHTAAPGDRLVFKTAAFEEDTIEFRHRTGFNRGMPCIVMGNDVLLQVAEGELAPATGVSATVRDTPPMRLQSPALLPGTVRELSLSALSMDYSVDTSDLPSEFASTCDATALPRSETGRSHYSVSDSGTSAARPESAGHAPTDPGQRRTLRVVLAVRRTLQQDLFAFVLSRIRFQNATLRNRLGRLEEEPRERKEPVPSGARTPKREGSRGDKRMPAKKTPSRASGKGRTSVRPPSAEQTAPKLVAPVAVSVPEDGEPPAPEATQREMQVSLVDLGGHRCSVKFPLTTSGGPNYTTLVLKPGPLHFRSLCLATVPDELRAYLSVPSLRSLLLYEHAGLYHHATSKFNLHPDPCRVQAVDITVAITFGARRGDNIIISPQGEIHVNDPEAFMAASAAPIFFHGRRVGTYTGTLMGSVDDERDRELDYELTDLDSLNTDGLARKKTAKGSASLLFDKVPLGKGLPLPEVSDPPMPGDQLHISMRLEVPDEYLRDDATLSSADYAAEMLAAMLQSVAYCNASQSPVVGSREIETRVRVHLEHPDYSEGTVKYVPKVDYFSAQRALRVCPPMVSTPTRVCRVELPDGAQKLSKFDASNLAVSDVESFGKGEIVAEIVDGYNLCDALAFNTDGTDLKLLKRTASLMRGRGKKGGIPMASPSPADTRSSAPTVASPLSLGRSPTSTATPKSPLLDLALDEVLEPQIIFFGETRAIGTLFVQNRGQRLVIKLGRAVGKSELLLLLRNVVFRTLQPDPADPAAEAPQPPPDFNYKKMVTISVSDGGLPSVLPIEVNVLSQTPRTELLLPIPKIKYRSFTQSIDSLGKVLPIAPQGRCALRSTDPERVPDCRAMFVNFAIDVGMVEGDKLTFMTPQQQQAARQLYLDGCKPRDAKLVGEVLNQEMWDGLLSLGRDGRIRVVRDGAVAQTTRVPAPGQKGTPTGAVTPEQNTPMLPRESPCFPDDGWVVAEVVADTTTGLRLRITEDETPEPITLAHLSYIINCVGFVLDDNRIVPGHRGVSIDCGNTQDPCHARLTVEVVKTCFSNIPERVLACPNVLRRRGTCLIPYPLITLGAGPRMEKGYVDISVRRHDEVTYGCLFLDDMNTLLDGRNSRIDNDVFYYRGDVIGRIANATKHRIRLEFNPFCKTTIDAIVIFLQLVCVRHDFTAGALPDSGFDVRLQIADGGGEPCVHVVNVQGSADLTSSLSDTHLDGLADLAWHVTPRLRLGSKAGKAHTLHQVTAKLKRFSVAVAQTPRSKSNATTSD